MPEITVSTFIRYNTAHDVQRNEDEWAANHAKKIIKGEELSGWFSWPLLAGYRLQIKQSNRSAFENDILARFAQHIVAAHPGVMIVPVPNGNATINSGEQFRTWELAEGIAEKMPNLSAFDALRWNTPMGQAHRNERRRDVDAHMSALRIKPGCQKDVIIFDDVVTSGSQLCAAKLKMEEAGFNVRALYAIFDVLDEGERGSAPCWRQVRRNPMRIADFFADLDI